MKKVIIVIAVLFCCSGAYTQEKHDYEAFQADEIWLKEIIKFPISFAPEIKYEGYEDLRFAKDWRKTEHEDFWCYTFAWHVKTIETQTAEGLETNIKLYYDGLMGAVNKKKNFQVPETTALFIKTEGEDTDFKGKIRVYDSFNSEDMMTLNVLVNVNYCKDSDSSVIIFRLSPQSFDHDIWERFKTVKLKTDICEM
ncbi:hypothetical protein [uncultured Psychroserpens sp.]|uniref:hypothetical protein n=1 Tax=uncultured Psychroserpens sp. TaxID=255436 RepID=UPI00262EC42D|nr:hypothetical protein [uncultured Psychroserpens sp.]